MPVNSDLTEAQVREFFTTLSNWGKWGRMISSARSTTSPGEAGTGRGARSRRGLCLHVVAPGHPTKSG